MPVPHSSIPSQADQQVEHLPISLVSRTVQGGDPPFAARIYVNLSAADPVLDHVQISRAGGKMQNSEAR